MQSIISPFSTQLAKATSLTFQQIKNTHHYTLIFHNIPYVDHNHRTLYADIILPDCTITYKKPLDPKIRMTTINSKTTIHNFQMFLYTTPLTINYYPTKDTIQLTYQN